MTMKATQNEIKHAIYFAGYGNNTNVSAPLVNLEWHGKPGLIIFDVIEDQFFILNGKFTFVT